MFRMYGNFQFKLEKDYYVNIKTNSYFQITKYRNTESYIVIFFSKDGNKLLEKNFDAKSHEFEGKLDDIVKEFEKKFERE